jgi:outer membrane protein OmpA-like peptidoglycan-associated protein
MKKLYVTVLLAALFTTSLSAQSDITNDTLVQNGDNVVVTFEVRTDDNSIPRNRKEVILPYLYNGKDTLFLDPVEIYGKNRFKRERQEYHIAGDKDWALGDNQIMKGEVYEYTAQARMKRWMKPAYLGIKRQMVGCACENDLADQPLGQFAFKEPELPARRIPQPQLVNASKEWAIGDDEMEIIFKVSKAEIDPEVYGNAVTFGKILDAVDNIYSNQNMKIEKIEVAGYASPEGTSSFNKWLGENRAKALIDYIISKRPQYGLTADHFRIVNGEENWDGLKRLLQSSGIEEKEEVISVIEDSSLTAETKKSKIKSMDSGRVWKKMLEEIYPQLRCARYLAIYYDSSVDNVIDVVNSANQMIVQGRASEAYELAMTVQSDSRVYNTIGSALMAQGRFEEAMPWFEKAKEFAPQQAQANIDAINAEYDYENQQKQALQEYLRKFE